jgi:sugar phosphate isomerase/epimerase
VPLGEGEVNIPAFLQALAEVEFEGPLSVEREVGDQQVRVRDVAHGLTVVNRLLERV